MRPARPALPGLLLLLTATLPAMGGCGSPAAPGGSPSASASATTTPAPTATTPGTDGTVLSDRVAYDWRWPNADGRGSVTHSVAVPPVPELVVIGVGDHPNDPGDRPYNRMSFSFTTAFPSYQFQFVDKLVADGSGQPIPLAGGGVLRIVFTPAQAHTQDGTTSSIVSQPPAALGLSRMVAYAQSGDFEGQVSYGIGIAWPIPQSNPQLQVRVHEVTSVNGQGQYRYVVAVDVDAR